NLPICHGVLAPRARWRGRVVVYGRRVPEPTASTAPLAAGPDGTGVKDRQSARLELGGPDAPGVRHRRASVSTLWRPPPPDRHAAQSRGHPEDPRAPRPRPLGAESWPRPPEFGAVAP